MAERLHCMIDLETLSTRPDAVFTQIGLCAFSPTEIIQIGGIRVDPDDAMKHGRHVSWDTICFWLTQDKLARDAMRASGGVPLLDALDGVEDFIAMNSCKMVWSLGADFDLSILSHAFKSAGRKVPWHYPNARCLRTYAKMFPDVERVRPNVPHQAHEDAAAQARWCQALMAAHGELKNGAR